MEHVKISLFCRAQTVNAGEYFCSTVKMSENFIPHDKWVFFFFLENKQCMINLTWVICGCCFSKGTLKVFVLFCQKLKIYVSSSPADTQTIKRSAGRWERENKLMYGKRYSTEQSVWFVIKMDDNTCQSPIANRWRGIVSQSVVNFIMTFLEQVEFYIVAEMEFSDLLR